MKMTARIVRLFSATAFLLACGTLSFSVGQDMPKSRGNYVFTSDWFTHDIPNWTRVLGELKGKPNLTYLEIGSYEGRSLFWVMDNILTHPSSKAIAIDIFEGDLEGRFLENVKRSGRSSSIKVIKGYSQLKLRDLPLNSCDVIYIDGDHRSRGVISDAILSWDLLKAGGIMIFDDYRLYSDLPVETRPEFAIDFFLTTFRDDYQVLINDYQLMIRKTHTPCNESMGYVTRLENTIHCSRLGPYIYYWKPQRLFDGASNKEITLNKAEMALVENTLLNLKLGFSLEVGKAEADSYRSLLSRLGLREINILSKDK